MFICPWDLEPCRRTVCRDLTCERTGDLALVSCRDCGGPIEGLSSTRNCVECVSVYVLIPEAGA